MPIDATRYATVCAALVLAVSCGCGRHAPHPTPPPAADALRIAWVTPADGDSIADTVRVEISAEGTMPARVILAANDTTVAERDEPPWSLQWLPSASSERTLRLLATAYGPGDDKAQTPERKVLWRPNKPPTLRFVAPALARATQRSSTDSLIAEAIDPEEGPLTGDALVWTSSLQGLLGRGERIPLSALLTGRHHLRVRASDRWHRDGWAERVLEIFEYEGGATPAGTLNDMRYALVARDPDVYAESLAPDFRFLFCLSDRISDPEVPSRWTHADEAAFVRCILQGNRHDLVAAEWKVASLQPAVIDERIRMKAELVGISLRVADGATDTLSVVSGSARVYLSRATDEDRWRVEQWHDLGGEAGISQGRLRLVMRRFSR